MKTHFTLLTTKREKSSWRKWLMILTAILMLGVLMPVTSSAQEKSDPPEYKQMLFATVGWPYGLNFNVTVMVDLDDLMLQSPDGQAGWTTIWITGSAGFGVSWMPGEVGYARSYPNGFDMHGNELKGYFDPEANYNTLSANLSVGRFSVSMSEGDNKPSYSANTNLSAAISLGMDMVAFEVKRSAICDAIINASGKENFSEILIATIFDNLGTISKLAYGGIPAAATNAILTADVRSPLCNGYDSGKSLPIPVLESKMREFFNMMNDENILCSVGDFSNRVTTIRKEMLHHGSPNEGVVKYDIFAYDGHKIKFRLADFPAGHTIRVSAYMMTGNVPQDQKDKVQLFANDGSSAGGDITGGYNPILLGDLSYVYGPTTHNLDVIADIQFTTTENTAYVTAYPVIIGGDSEYRGVIRFEDITYNNSKSNNKDDYTYYQDEYIKKSEITYPPIPDNIVKAPKMGAKPKKMCAETENTESATKGATIPIGNVVMCKSASWFCFSGCFLYAIDEVDYFRKGETYDYSNSDYWIAGSGPVLATFIYNYGCHSNMNFTTKFFKPDGTLHFERTQNYHCYDPGYWGYVAPGMYIHDGIPEGEWKLEYWVGSSLKKTVYFDVYCASDADRFTFIDPTPADGNIISGNWNNGQFHMTAAANGHVGGATKMKFYVDREVHEEMQIHNAIGTSIWNVNNVSDGEHTIQVKINSTLGWLSTEERTIVVDNTPPTYCNITSPSSGATIASVYTTVNVNTDGDRVEFFVDGQSRGYDEQAPFSKEILLTRDNDNAEITAVAHNLAGKLTSTGTTVNLRFVKIVSPINNASLPADGTIEIEVEAVGTNPTQVKFYVAGAYKGYDNTVPYTYTWDIPASSSGAYELKAVAEYASYANTEDNINVVLGGSTGKWQITSSLTSPVFYGSAAVVMNGYIYSIGGMAEIIERAKIKPDGSLNAWDTCGIMTTCRSSAAAHNENYIYICGTVNSVERIRVFADGSMGTAEVLPGQFNVWDSHTTDRMYPELLIYGNYIYAIGGSFGNTDNVTETTIEYALINKDGTLGDWKNTTSAALRRQCAAVVANGYIYLMGGYDAPVPEGYVQDVVRSKINSDGSLGSWITLPGLMTSQMLAHDAVINNNFIYVMNGGHVEQAYIYPNGDLSPWQSLADTTYCSNWYGSLVTNGDVNDAIYAVGGNLCRLNVEYTICANGPILTGVVSSNITANSAAITWTTNIPTDSRVDYWTDNSWPNFFSTDLQNTSPMVTSHNVTITEHLEPSTLYYYRAVSTNDNENTSMAGTYSFTTSDANILPVATIISASPTWGTVPLAVSFTSSGSDSDGSISSYFWNFGDGSTSTFQNAGHIYTSADTCIATLTVTDNSGATGTASQEIIINPVGEGYPYSENVTAFSAAPGNGQISLNWNNPTDADFVGTKILRKTTGYPSGPEDGTVVYNSTGTSYTNIGLVNGTTYYYKAFSYDEVPNYASGVTTSETPINNGSFGDALDNNSLTWATDGNEYWFSQTATSYYGGDAAQSGSITHNQNSYLQTTVTDAGTLTFYWKVSSENGWDYLRFYIDGVEQASIGGAVDWQLKTYDIASGSHTLQWKYIKDESVSSGSDCGWLDKVEFTGVGGTDTEIIVSDGGTDIQSRPFHIDGNRWQTVNYSSDIGQSGTIKKIYFRASNTVSTTFNDCTIKLGHTNLSTLTTTFDNNYNVDGSIVVYDDNLALNSTAGEWFEIDLTTDFNYNNAYNLLIEINQSGSSASISTYLDDSFGSRLVYWYNGSTGFLYVGYYDFKILMNTGTKAEFVDIEETATSDNYFFLNSYPNPFNSTTTIEYTLPETGNVSIKIYNIAGQLVSILVDEHKPAGKYSVQWNATDSKENRINAGIYFYRIETGKFMQTKKLLLMK